jgi:hypothetical protein
MHSKVPDRPHQMSHVLKQIVEDYDMSPEMEHKQIHLKT